MTHSLLLQSFHFIVSHFIIDNIIRQLNKLWLHFGNLLLQRYRNFYYDFITLFVHRYRWKTLCSTLKTNQNNVVYPQLPLTRDHRPAQARVALLRPTTYAHRPPFSSTRAAGEGKLTFS